MTDLLTPLEGGKELGLGRISKVDAPNVWAVVQSFSTLHEYGPMEFEHAADATVGDRVLVAFDEQGNAWISGWQGTAGGGGGASGPAGGVLSGTYPNPSFAVDMATQAELNAAVTLINALVPIGTTLGFPFATNPSPSYFLPADGASYLRADYPDLFANIGTDYGAADGTHFNVPDYGGFMLVGQTYSDADFNSMTDTGGEKTHALTTAELAAHTHVFTGSALAGHSHTFTGSALSNHTHTLTSDSAGTPAGTLSSDSAGTPAGTVGNEASHTHTMQNHTHTIAHTHTFTYNNPGDNTHTGSGNYASGIQTSGGTGGTVTTSGTSTANSGAPSNNTTAAGSSHTHSFTGNALGTHTHTFTGSALGTHTHTVGNASGGTPAGTLDSVSAGTPAGTNANAGSGTAHNNMPPYKVTKWYIRAL